MNMKKIVVALFIISLFLNWAAQARAGESLFYKEANIIGGYSDRDKWVGKSSTLKNSIGFEYYKKFSNDYGDFLTADLQVRLAYDSLKNSSDAWGIEIHNAWLEYKLGLGHNIKVGHFDPAFGLEPILDTHGTILQTLANDNIGFKKDWGLAFKGVLSEFDYKVALQLGSGMSIRRKDGSFLFSGRLGSSQNNDFQYGISLLYGEVLNSSGMNTFPKNNLLSDTTITKMRVGLDGQYLSGPYLVKGELAYGEDQNEEVLGYLCELDYTIPSNQNCQLELQFKSWINDLGNSKSDDSTLTLGASYKLNQNTTIRAAFSHDFNLVDNQEDDMVLVQVYFYGW